LECGVWGSKDAELYISIQELSVEIWSDHEDAIVFINGESTGKSVEEKSMVGLIEYGDTVEIYVERMNEKGELERSEEVTATAGDFINLPVFTSDSSDSRTEDEEEVEEEAETAEVIDEDKLRTLISEFR